MDLTMGFPAPSTQILLNGKKPGEFAPALQSNAAKRKLVRAEKLAAYPAGLDVAGMRLNLL